MKKFISLLLALTLLVSMTACGSTQSTSETAASSSTASSVEEAQETEEEEAVTQEEPAQEPAQEEAEEEEPVQEETAIGELVREISLPISTEGATLTMWTRNGFDDTDPIQTTADSPIIAQVEELTGVHIEFTEVSSAAESESFNLMIAGGDYADIIYNFAKLYSGGIDNAVENEVIVDLSDYLDATPCFASILSADDEVRKAATTDSGVIGSFYSFYESTPYTTTGLTIRGDWLEELGLDSPVTYDDMENVLLAFKSAYDPEYPLYISSCGTILEMTYGYSVAYSVSGDNSTLFCAQDGTVVFSATTDNFREYLVMMHRWYEEGLISKDFATDGDWMFMNSEYQAMMSTGNVGIVSLGAGLYSQFISTGVDLDSDYTLTGIVNPRITEDQGAATPASGRTSDAIFSISNANGSAELACQWCDFWYTTEGSMLSNYGIEDVSYTIGEDGTPEYTDMILNNETYSDRSMKNLYSFNANSLMDPAKDLNGISDEGYAAVEVWRNDLQNESFETISMTKLSLTTDESDRYSTICADAQTYCLEKILCFINGSLSIDDDWDNFVAVLESMGIDEATAIVQDAYDRYLAR